MILKSPRRASRPGEGFVGAIRVVLVLVLTSGCVTLGPPTPAADLDAANASQPTGPALPPPRAEILEPIQLAGPYDGARLQDGSGIWFTWQGGTTNIRANRVTTSIHLDGDVACTSQGNGCQASVPPGTHEWRAVAVSTSGASVESGTWRFTVADPDELSDPTPLSPGQGERVAQGVTFRWLPSASPTPDRVTYAVLVDGATACTATGTTTCTASLAGGPHEWRVQATTPSGRITKTSPQVFFAVNRPPTPGVILSPSAGSHDTLENAVIRYQPGTDPDGDAVTTSLVLLDETTRTTTTHPCTALTCNAQLHLARTYTATLHTTDGTTTTPSPSTTFRTNAPPLPPLGALLDGLTQVRLMTTLTLPPATDPDGDAVVYNWFVFDEHDQIVYGCYQHRTNSCAIPFPKAGRPYTLVINAEDALGTPSPTVRPTITTVRPIVFLHGWTGDGSAWSQLAWQLHNDGYPVLDFDPFTAGPQLLSYTPDHEQEGIAELAATDVWPSIETALSIADYPADQQFDIVAHSMGGLIGRALVELPGHGGGNGWELPQDGRDKIRTIIMVGTPNNGSPRASPTYCRNLAPGDWLKSCLEMDSESFFLSAWMPPPARLQGVHYATISGDYDDVVPTRNVVMGAVQDHMTAQGACHSYTLRGWADCRDWGAGTLVALPDHPQVAARVRLILFKSGTP